MWSYLAHVTVLEEDSRKKASLATALAALDEQDIEEALSIISELQDDPDKTADFGGYLFVLGAVKSHQANNEWSAERQRATHLVAARYFQKALEFDLPANRRAQLMFLLGQSLIQGNQSREGIAILQDSLKELTDPPAQVYRLLTEAYLNLPDPNYSEAFQHNQVLLSKLPQESVERTHDLLLQARILTRLGKPTEAQELLNTLGDAGEAAALKLTTSGIISLELAKQAAHGTPEQVALVESALRELQEAQRLDTLNGEITRQAMVLIGQCYELQDQRDAAIAQYELIQDRYGDSAESVVATIHIARLVQADADADKALGAYRAVLDSVGDPLTYANPLLPISEFRKQLLAAHGRFLDQKTFPQAMSLVDQFSLLFGAITVTELRATTHVAWAETNLREAAQSDRRKSREALELEGRYHFRAAGRAYQTLSELRAASNHYIDDLWQSAENYYRGQSYTFTALVLEEYLHHESRTRRSQALLRYGQSQLATGKTTEAITALEECIEIHPRDASVFAARIACAQAYLQTGKPEEAEKMLLANLAGATLTPASPEWRDSIFLLGNYLHESGRYLEAIEKLEEAVARYPEAPQSLMAQYTIARSFHNAARDPSSKARVAKTENERQKNRKLRDDNLESALGSYSEVLRKLSLESHDHNDQLINMLRRNCYMMQGDVLFQLRRYAEARSAYANVSTLYQHEPFVLESFVRIANCWHRLNQPVNARQTVAQAKLLLDRLPKDLNYKESTNFSRQQWGLLLDEMAKW